MRLSQLCTLEELVKNLFKLFIAILACGILLVIIWIGWVWERTERCRLVYMQVQRGDSPARVIELCGQPGRISFGLETNLWWEDSEHVYSTNGICIQEFHYYPPVSICGESWEIGFDAKSNVVSKFHFISP